MASDSDKAWVCSVCGYVHHGEQAPDVCPVCGAPKQAFEPQAIQSKPAAKAEVRQWQCLNCGFVHAGAEPPAVCEVCGSPQDCFEPVAEAGGQAEEDGEATKVVVVGGGIAGLAAAEGFPVRSTFPKEGGVLDSGYWIVPEHAEPVDEIHEFINYICDPVTQASLSRNLGTAPIVDPALTDLSQEELDAVSSSSTPIIPRYDIYKEHGEWISDRWNQMLAG